MTAAYDIERVAASCERLAAAIAAAVRHPLPEWLMHRIIVLQNEANGLCREIENHKEGAEK